MKKVLKVLFVLLIVVYVVIVGFLTLCLLKYNEFNITEFKNSSLIIIEDDELKPDYEKGSLVVVKHNSNDDIAIGDKIFFYNTYANQVNVNYTKVIDKEKLDENETTFTLEGDYPLSSKYVIGKSSTTKVYNGIGLILKALESRWGYLFCVILPILFAFIYEIYVVVKEVKGPKGKKKKKKIIIVEEDDDEEL